MGINAYRHDGDVPAGAGTLDDNVRWCLEHDIASEEDGQGKVVLIVSQLEILEEPKDLCIADICSVKVVVLVRRIAGNG